MKDKILGGLIGLAVGDALGVPVEFKSRAYLNDNPVSEMIGYGTHYQPAGTWSDDSSLTFCLTESLCNGYDIYDIGDKSVQWYQKGYWTPDGKVFDIGITTQNALDKLSYEFIRPDFAGMDDIRSNGNGSLMRILPLAFFLKDVSFEEKVPIIAAVSSITHRHIRSIISCVIYVEFVCNLLSGFDLKESYLKLQPLVKSYYRDEPDLEHFKAILEQNIGDLAENEIQSSGYVIHTLEASLWCMFNCHSYEESVLRAVNLGDDTDTTGAVTGGLAGVFYGINMIPYSWINSLARIADIYDLGERFAECLHLPDQKS
jgi:ADP-ribosyl-[dinitrogen reductase] hydrolase